MIRKVSPASMFTGDSIVGNISVYLFANVLNGAIPFLLLPVLTRYLTPSEYGTVGMFQMLLAVFAAFTGLSVQGAANRKYFDREDGVDLPAFIGSCLQILAASTLLVALLVFLFRAELSEVSGVPGFWVMMAVLVSGVNFIGMIRLGQWQVRNQSARYGAFQVGLSLVNMALSLWLVVGLKGGFEGRLWGQNLAILLFGVLAVFLLHRDRLLKFRWRPDYVQDALKFGVPLIPHIAGMFLLSMVDRLVINNTLGLSQVGIYMVAVQLAMGMGIVADSINKAYVPWLFERLKADKMQTKRRIVAGTYGYFAGALLVAAAVALIAPWFVPWFAGEAFKEAGAVLGWLALGQAFQGMYLMVTNYVFYSQKTFALSLVTISVGLIHVVLVVVLTQAYGIQGAGIAFAASAALRFMLTWGVAQSKHSMPWLSPSIRAWASVFRRK